MTRTNSSLINISEPIIGKDIALILNRILSEKQALENVPAYLFDIVLLDGTGVGHIDLRIGDSEALIKYSGHIGYGIDRAHRGHGYAAEACKLVKYVAIHLGFEELWITCNPGNTASIRTCEKIGSVFVEQVDIPKTNELWRRGDRQKRRYRWDLT